MAFRKIFLTQVDSTQLYLIDYIKKYGYKTPLIVVTDNQTHGISSKNNCWESVVGNLYFSFVLPIAKLTNDLPLQSASIYFSFLLKHILSSRGSKCYIKWPNDFYIKNKKIGGTITKVSSNLLYCGIGLNIYEPNKNFGKLDINIDKRQLIDDFTNLIEKYLSFATIFKKFMLEYHNNCSSHKTSINGKIISLKSEMLQNDGSLLIDGKKEYSLR